MTAIDGEVTEYDDDFPDYGSKNHARIIDRILLNHWYQLGFLFLLTAVISPILIIVFLYTPNIPISPDHPTEDTCVVAEGYRVPCGWFNISEKHCDFLQCCYKDKCYHRIPSRYSYKWSDESNSYEPKQQLTTALNPSYENLNVAFEELSDTALLVHFYDENQIHMTNKTLDTGLKYNYTIHAENAGVEVHRIEDGVQLFSTIKGPLIASRGYWEITAFLSDEAIFGLGRLHLKGDEKFLFYNNESDHNRIPVVMAYRKGKSHGMYVQTDSVLEIEVIPKKLMVLRTLTATPIGFTFGIVVGGAPKDVVHQLRKYTGTPVVPAYWTLGAHFCRDSLDIPDVSKAIKEAKKFASNAVKFKLPYESECIHENLFSLDMNPEDSTRKELTKYISKIHSTSKRFLMSISPHITNDSTAYTEAVARNILYKNTSCSVLQGKYLGRNVSFPEYGLDATDDWMKLIVNDVVGINDADGFIFRDNWPVNFNYTANFTMSQFPYMNEDIKRSLLNTIPWNASTTCDVNRGNFHIESHNMYGINFARKLHKFAPNRDNMLMMTAAYSLTAQADFGIHNQNVNASWLNLKRTILQTLSQGLFGNPMISTPVCGSTDVFDTNLHEGLCIRWYITAATLSVFRLSSHNPRRDPFSLPTAHARDAALNAIRKRYALLPYFATILQSREPLARPMFYNYHSIKETFMLDEQYMLGEGLLVAHILYPDQEELNVYLPGDGAWYEFWAGQKQLQSGWNKKFPRETDWIIFVAGGNIIPMHNFQEIAGGNADTLKLTPLTLAVALQCNSTVSGRKISKCAAEGSLHVEGDVFLRFTSDEKNLQITDLKAAHDAICVNHVISHVIDTVLLYGINNSSLIRMASLGADLCKDSNDSINIKYVFNKT